MQHARRARKVRALTLMSADRVALASGGLFGAIVFALCFFYAEVDTWEAVFRVGVTFLVAYLATFVFVRVLQRIASAYLRAEQERETIARKPAEEPASPSGEMK
jgi:hypothetical protein